MTACLVPRPRRRLAPLEPGGTWTDVAGARAGVASAGLYRTQRDDVTVLVAPGLAAAVTTRSTAASAPCRYTRGLVPGLVHAVVVNAGNANAATGPQGVVDVQSTARAAAELLGCPPDAILVCSTGVIGVPLPMDRLVPGVAAACSSLEASGERVARALMTTDTRPKQAACRLDGVHVGGVAKGSGMIHPDMGTMLGFLVTDAAVAHEDGQALQAMLGQVNDRTFNAVTVDGDTSTSDTLILQTTGAGASVRPGGAGWQALERAVEAVARELGRAIAADGEGASTLIEVLIEGTPDDATARRAARAVAVSPLVKTAVHGRDANWGRVVGALGAARVEGLDALDLDFAGVPVLRAGRPVAFDEDAATRALRASEVLIHARLPGAGLGEAWGCDLSADYIAINADYRS